MLQYVTCEPRAIPGGTGPIFGYSCPDEGLKTWPRLRLKTSNSEYIAYLGTKTLILL